MTPIAVSHQQPSGCVGIAFGVAEGEGFEPSRRSSRLRDFQSRALGRTMRPFHASTGAERVGFEPTEAMNLTAFRERHLQPLGHLSSVCVCLAKRNSAGSVAGPALRLVRPEGLEPPTFWSATKRSIQLSYGRIPTLFAQHSATFSTV